MTDNLGAMRRLSELMRRVNASTDTQDVLEEIAHGVVDVLGYGVAAIARIEGDALVMTNVAGPPEVVDQILGRRTPSDQIMDEFRQAERWGILRYIPPGRMTDARLNAAWIPDVEIVDDDDSWHPEASLYAPLYSATGELLGNMAVDLPPGGRIPGPDDRELLEMFVVQAGLALSNAHSRERLTERVRLGEMVNEIIRAGSHAGLDEILNRVVIALAEGLETMQCWVLCFPDEGRGPEHGAGHPRRFPLGQDISGLRQDLVEPELVHEPVEVARNDGSDRVPHSRVDLQTLMDWLGAERVVICPITTRQHLLGYFVLAFPAQRLALTSAERASLSEVGRELGRIVHQTRILETEQRLVEELRELARYRSELIATISHELKTPLTAIIGHAELLEERHPGLASLDAIIRNGQRLDRLIANLLHYSKVQGRRESVRTAVDLVELCAASVDLLSLRAAQGRVALTFERPPTPTVVYGDGEEMARVLDNLIDNAVKYTPVGGRVTVGLDVDREKVTVFVTDTGIGISTADCRHVFTAFHRSTNPDALSVPGTGLGLPIAARIAQAHGGEITVESSLGAGSTFRFSLPLPSAD